MKYDSVILDVDGTIWNTTGVVAKAWNKAIDDMYPQVKKVTAQILQGQFGKPMSEIADNLFEGLTAEQKKELIDECCKNEHVAIAQNQDNITYDGVVQTIKEISKIMPIFIVSNCQSGYIELVCEKNGITENIKDFECYGDTGLFKDKNIQLLVKRNNLKSPVYVGDTQGDYEACKSAGVPFIWAKYGFGKNLTGNFETIENFSQLQEKLNG